MRGARAWDEAGLHRLLALAESLGSRRCILNIEDEFKADLPPSLVASRVAQYEIADVAISTVAWLYNDVDYRPLTHLPVLLQIFPQDNRWDPSELEQRQADCVRHAREKGFRYVGVTFQAYGGAQPEWYAYHRGPRSLYAGDDVGAGRWEAWRP
jgi:hypothetical protein